MTTDWGQPYRFYFGVVLDVPDTGPTPEGKPVEAGPTFQARGSDEVYYCDRCLIQAAARGEKLRSRFFLVLGLFAILVLVFLVLASSQALWVCLILLLIIAALGGAAYKRYRQLQAALRGKNPDQIRYVISSCPKIQTMGDAWAIAHCREKLQQEGAETFLTRREYQLVTGPPSY
jgi:hypothetical protein